MINHMLEQRSLDETYRDASGEQAALLKSFRSTHPPGHLDSHGVGWTYFSSGQGAESLLFLPGALGRAEVAFRHILALEKDYRIIAPNYPPIVKVSQLLEGIRAILEHLSVARMSILGSSMGGGIAQCLVQRQPSVVNKLILSHTGVPDPLRARINSFIIEGVRLMPLSLIRAALMKELLHLVSAAPAELNFWRAYFKELLSALTKEEIVNIYRRAIDLEQNYSFTAAEAAGWPCEVLILESDNDSIIKAKERAALKKIYPRSRVYTFKGAGHGASIVCREEFISVVRQFLKEPRHVG